MFDKKLKRNAKCSILCCELHYAEKLTFNMGSNQAKKARKKQGNIKTFVYFRTQKKR